ncbi:Sedoheptulokinase [Phytophthora megakarya]|uniref:Sedoheptulokinase n=1 Tax=Phytophthora megakarya TaxID=4795 RepID=A0A225UDZ1_9STRA|nr:Sedoheptulokinase [Phytophthora megakarya]
MCIKFKRQVISRVEEIGIDAAIKETKVPRRTVRDWVSNQSKKTSFDSSQKIQGRKEIIPFSHALVLYMKDERRDNKLVTTRTLIEYMKSHQHTWLVEYLQTKKSKDSEQKALYKLCQQFSKRMEPRSGLR